MWGLALRLQRLATQRLSGGEVALVIQQPAEVVGGGERVRMPIAERLTRHLQCLAEQRFSLVDMPWACSSIASEFRVEMVLSPSVRLAWSRALRSSMLSASR